MRFADSLFFVYDDDNLAIEIGSKNGNIHRLLVPLLGID